VAQVEAELVAVLARILKAGGSKVFKTNFNKKRGDPSLGRLFFV
jgi:hypothetical protein